MSPTSVGPPLKKGRSHASWNLADMAEAEAHRQSGGKIQRRESRCGPFFC